ncbi:MAG TPA: hypothetical protein VFT99_03050, partial [Roseiflexaceae bacterium]|nr:hypothetical protein [Roseiflexaceae bacterium]
SAAGVAENSALWLVLTPRFLPLTMHWTTGRHSGTQAVLLQADTPLSAQLHILLDTLGLRERVEGPMKSTATLTQTPGGPPLPLDKSLLELQVRSHSSIWLVVVATCLPVMLHWHDGQRDVVRRVFLEGARTLGKLADDQARLIPAARLAINGPEHCRVALRTSPAGPDLPAERTLNEVAVEEDDALWLVWSPTVAEVVLHYSDPVRQTARTRKVFVPLTLAIHDIKKDVAQQAGLPNPHDIHLAGAPDGQVWPDRGTLEQYEIQTGSMVWVRVDQPGPAAVAPTPALAVLVAIVIVVIGSVWLLVPKDSGSALATTPTVLPGATHAPAARPPARRTPTRAADTQLRADYEAGLAAYRSQAWPEAAGFFKRVYSRDPHYQ